MDAIFAKIYENGCFDELINYKSDPTPPLSPEDAAWADAILKEKGLR